MTKVGFIGTQNGLTAMQLLRISDLIDGASELHHGDCVGADDEVDRMATMLGIPKFIHPPLDEKKRAFCFRGTVAVLPSKPYLERNQDIVDDSDFLVAAPLGAEKTRSGTWATIRYARKMGKRICIVMPDGRVDTQRAEEESI